MNLSFNCSSPGCSVGCSYLEIRDELRSLVLFFCATIYGLIYAFFGYRCFRVVMFLSGFTTGTLLMYRIATSLLVLPPIGNAAVSLTAGVLVGCVSRLVSYVGVFLSGLQLGVYVGVALALGLQHWPLVAPLSPVAALVCVMATAALTGLAALAAARATALLLSSVHGAAVVAIAVDCTFFGCRLLSWGQQQLGWTTPAAGGGSDSGGVAEQQQQQQLCWLSWLVLAGWPVLSVVAVLVQLLCAVSSGQWGKKRRRRRHRLSRQQQQLQLQQEQQRSSTLANNKCPPVNSRFKAFSYDPHRTRASRHLAAECSPQNYRQVHRKRTRHGDVIAQEYYSSFNDNSLSTRDKSTLQSDTTRLTGTGVSPALYKSHHEAEVLRSCDSIDGASSTISRDSFL